jgi:Rad3-related DNA helicase
VLKTWGDGKKVRLEQQLGEFVRGLEDVAEEMKKQRAEEEEARIRRRKEEEQRWERQRRQRLDEQRAVQLKEQASRWREARELREYLAAVKKAKSIMLPTGLEIASIQEWVAWAEAYVERLDPLGAQGAETEET